MRPAEVLARATRYLEAHEVEEPHATAELLMEHVLGVDRARLYSRAEGLSSAEARAFGLGTSYRIGRHANPFGR